VLRGEGAADGTTITLLKDWTAGGDRQRQTKLTTREGAVLAAYAAVEVFVAAAQARSVNDGKAMASWLSGGNSINSIVGALQFTASGDLQQQPYVWYRWQQGVLKSDPVFP
jgi:ABC-type branched-subunit amino acid transport system substrate-binding protein